MRGVVETLCIYGPRLHGTTVMSAQIALLECAVLIITYFMYVFSSFLKLLYNQKSHFIQIFEAKI